MDRRRYEHGLVIGKFHPPHRGHGFLIETALQQSERVTSITCAAPGERPHARARADALGCRYPALHSYAVEPPASLSNDDSAGWARYVAGLFETDPALRTGKPPDVIFTSETYGEVFAAHAGIAHVEVDLGRRTVPVSGRRLRADLLAGWDDILNEARPLYLFRVAVVGPESAGKTTLARTLARRLGAVWVPEYGRTFTDGLTDYSHTWRVPDFVHIQEAQIALEDALATKARGILVCDTTCDTTAGWMDRYGVPDESGTVHRKAREERGRYQLHILCLPDFPFVQDGTRDTEGDAAGRRAMLDAARTMFLDAGVDFVEVGGSRRSRADLAIRSIVGRSPGAERLVSRAKQISL